MTCDRPIRDRNGQDLGYCCNLTKGHLGRCCQTMYSDDVVPSKETEVPHVRTQEP